MEAGLNFSELLGVSYGIKVLEGQGNKAYGHGYKEDHPLWKPHLP